MGIMEIIKIKQNNYNEDEWIAYYEGYIKPMMQPGSEIFTREIFTRQERALGNKVVFEEPNLSSVSMCTKMNLVQMVDRAMLLKDTGTLTEGDTENENN